MTNEEIVLEQIRFQKRNAEDCVIDWNVLDYLENMVQENTKLKAEIEQLNGELKSEREWRYNARIELLDRNKEIELLKEEIESRKTAGIKNNSNSRNDIEQLKSTNAELCEEIAELEKLIPRICETCKYEDLAGTEEPCENCKHCSSWKMKGGTE